MMAGRSKGRSKAKEIPQWKLDMMRAEEGATSSPPKPSDAVSTSAAPAPSGGTSGGSNKRAREEEAPAVSDAAAEFKRKAEAAVRAHDVLSTEVGCGAGDDDDDDDDDDADLSKYQLVDDDDDQVVVNTGPKEPALTREQQLLMREEAWGHTARKSTRTFMVDDNLNSEEQSAGRERTQERKAIMAGASAIPKLPTSFAGAGGR